MIRKTSLTLIALLLASCSTVDLNGLNPDNFQGQLDPDGGGSGVNLFADVNCDDVDSTFSTQVQPVLDANCATSGCHSGVSPSAQVQLDATNTHTPSSLPVLVISSPGYDAFNVHQSEILLTPLANDAGGSGGSHTGGVAFQDADDPDLVALYCWLEGGLENDADNAFNFGEEVYPIFQNSCQGGGCHSNNTTRIILNANLTPREMYANIVSDMPNGPYVAANDENSTIYTKPTNQVAHGGNEVFAVGSTQAEIILNWINNGAPAD